MIEFFKNKHHEATLLKDEYSFLFAVKSLLNELPLTNLPLIIECYNIDVKEVKAIDLLDITLHNNKTSYFGSKNGEKIKLESEIVGLLLKYDIIEMSLSKSFLNKIENCDLFYKFVEGKDIKYFADLFLRIDTQHDFVFIKWKVDFKFDFYKLSDRLTKIFKVKRVV